MIAETKKETKTSTAKPKVVRKKAVKKIEKTEEIVLEKNEELKEEQSALGAKVEKSETAEAVKRVYLYAIGRRKEAIATVKLFKNGKGEITINKKKYTDYFRTFELEQIISAPLKSVGQADKVDIEARVLGGGLVGQAEAVRLGISRALVQLNINFKKNLRKAGFLTRDPRVKERKKYGLRRARRAPQWQKR